MDFLSTATKNPEEYSTVDKVGSEKHLAGKFCFV